jgi:hypothetical protein
MSYEAAILSAGGDDSVLLKSFIIAADDAAAQWYSLLSPGVSHRLTLRAWSLARLVPLTPIKEEAVGVEVSYGPPWAHYLGGY